MAELTRAFYDAEGVAERYGETCELYGAETVMIRRASLHIVNQPVLEIGVGAGRAAAHFQKLTARYFAIDFSEQMLRQCRRGHPTLPLALCDARACCFRGATFQAVAFLFNGIDDVDSGGRDHILNEIKRMLRPGGVFLFSSHNLESDIARPHASASGFAMVDECSGGFHLPTYYIRKEFQVAQLESHGFERVEVFDREGEPVGDLSREPYLFYSTHKRLA